jgi:hypothetical protein
LARACAETPLLSYWNPVEPLIERVNDENSLYCPGRSWGSNHHLARREISPRFARIEIIESIAVVHLEVQRWSGKLAGAQARASDVFTLLKCDGEWKITHKLIHWHDR